jgi:membrane glycosyltransferase
MNDITHLGQESIHSGRKLKGNFSERAFNPRWPRLRRLIFFSLVGLSTATAAAFMVLILIANGFAWIELAILVLFTTNFLLIALSFWSATAGFVVQALGLDPISLRRRRRLMEGHDEAPITTRTALVMPIYNENPERVFAGIETIYASLAATGEIAHFDFFVLSDSTHDDIAAEEERRWAAACRKLDAGGRMFYRRRQPNSGRKAGNIADFCRNWGAAYESMVVLDADSIMSGPTIVELVRLMEANPSAGLIQTLPMPVNQTTFFGRCLQFAGRLYSPVLAHGVSFWQIDESNYWGHNAIIRTRPFTEHCGLPVLRGKPPFGGEILSHDFVEAALLRRAGWFVYFEPDLAGSYEELPGNIIDYATRDRRWCQGNLQHLKLLAARGFHPLSRLHLFHGALAYLSSPLWLAFLLLSTAAIVELAVTGHNYFPRDHQLFPEWPVSKWAETVSLFTVTLSLLFLPKVYSLILTLDDRRLRRSFGGTAKLLASAATELVFSMLIAPVMMGLHSYFVSRLLLGKGVAWNPQDRSERGLSVVEAFTYLGLLFAGGVVWGALIIVATPGYFWWILPVLAGLVLSVPIAVLSSRSTIGKRARRRGLLLTPEELAPPEELRRLDTALAADHAVETSSEEVEAAASRLPRTPPVIPRVMEPQRFDRLPPSPLIRRGETVG